MLNSLRSYKIVVQIELVRCVYIITNSKEQYNLNFFKHL